jgi:site-specific DNA-cytosine methylase
MSSNGAGRISAAIREGKRPKEDERNRLILPGIDVLESLQPDWFILENVKRMENTVIRNERHESENIMDCLSRRMKPFGYTIRSCVLDFRNYGVPHHRERLITIGCRLPQIVHSVPSVDNPYEKKLSPLHPPATHGGSRLPSWVTLRQTVGDLPPLDSLSKRISKEDPYHCVPRWNESQYFWMKHTPEGVISSDLKGHPQQNRVLSLREIMRLSTLDFKEWGKEYDFSGIQLGKWDDTGSFSPRLVREVIGESIPPLAMKCIVEHLLVCEKKYNHNK